MNRTAPFFLPRAPQDAPFPRCSRRLGSGAAGLAVLALEAWLRMPVGPLLEVTREQAAVRLDAWSTAMCTCRSRRTVS